MKQPKMCLIYVFGALAITSGVFSQDTSTLPPETRGKLQKTDSYSLMHRHLYTYTNSYIHTHTQRVGSVQACLFSSSPPSIDLFVAVGSSVKIPCSDGEEKGVEWRSNSSVLVSSPVLSIQNSSLKDQGIYTCHQPNGDLIQTVSLHLGCRFMHIFLYCGTCQSGKMSHCFPMRHRALTEIWSCVMFALFRSPFSSGCVLLVSKLP